ncbi:MAG: carbon storage regulator CsrA [Nitrospirae bacterium]|nr:carbon storage regulator CsrA [Nitrospirota bacterium]
MLVLTRKLGEGITIDRYIRVVVLDVKGGQVRLGIDAPHTIQIHRDEIYAKILEENKKAASTGTVPIEALEQIGSFSR